jgi:TATA-box binding protein (TBP) (component of TFIID and TFIIIB)
VVVVVFGSGRYIVTGATAVEDVITAVSRLRREL